jgi:hypothetical protein
VKTFSSAARSRSHDLRRGLQHSSHQQLTGLSLLAVHELGCYLGASSYSPRWTGSAAGDFFLQKSNARTSSKWIICRNEHHFWDLNQKYHDESDMYK